MSQHSPAFPPLDSEALDLVIKHATVGLEGNEKNTFESISKTHADEVEKIQLTVAAFDLAIMNRLASSDGIDADQAEERLPTSLRSSLVADADSFFQNQTEPSEDEIVERSPRRSNESNVGPPVSRREIIAMAIAAASLLLVFTGLNPLSFNPNAAKELTTPQKLAAFLAQRPGDLKESSFEAVMTPSAGGKVYWSNEQQEGYMVLTGLKENDPVKRQYQLWIFDTDPAQEIPVDGGVFDFDLAQANEQGEVVVPIRAHVPVEKAVMFAITGERPGGVMRSDRSDLPMLAKIN